MCEHGDSWSNFDTFCIHCVAEDHERLQRLTAENEALHGLLAQACELLNLLVEEPFMSTPTTQQRAADVLAQIKEGAV